MRKASLLIVFLMTFLLGFSQNKDTIIMNDVLVKEYFKDYISEALSRGHDVQSELLEKIDYIIIVPEGVKVCELSQTYLSKKLITLDSNVTIDRLILKTNLYRELSYVLGVPYNVASVMMDRRKLEGFSYSAFDDADIMSIELTNIMKYID
jgi:hypothetical protein|tara:strand:- start:71439 stop:71891 length:453 start_codon:yes stop_codon:yes gene_type:complete